MNSKILANCFVWNHQYFEGEKKEEKKKRREKKIVLGGGGGCRAIKCSAMPTNVVTAFQQM